MHDAQPADSPRYIYRREQEPKLDGWYGLRITKDLEIATSNLSWSQRKLMRREIRQVLEKWATLPDEQRLSSQGLRDT